jgi:hypothetical protein
MYNPSCQAIAWLLTDKIQIIKTRLRIHTMLGFLGIISFLSVLVSGMDRTLISFTHLSIRS